MANSSLCRKPPSVCHVERRATPVVETSHLFVECVKNDKLTAFHLGLRDPSTSFHFAQDDKMGMFYQSLGQPFSTCQNFPLENGYAAALLCGSLVAGCGTASHGFNQSIKSNFTANLNLCYKFCLLLKWQVKQYKI